MEKVLLGYQAQRFTDFEVVIADDGSDERTKQLVEEMSSRVPFAINHVWHEDAGFRKTIILNKAIGASRADYIVFTDGDCIPRADFLEQHVLLREPGRFLSGGYYKLPENVSSLIAPEDIASQRCFSLEWLLAHGLKKSFKNHKLTAEGWKERALNRLTPTSATWNGMNSSGWRKDILLVNGFDERMQYGGEDREMGERMMNTGIKGKQIRYSAVCLHLHHDRGYVKPEMLRKNAAIRLETKKNNSTWTAYGIEQS